MGRGNNKHSTTTGPDDILLPPPPYNLPARHHPPHANNLVLAETTTTIRTEVTTTTETTFFSFPLWRKRPSTASSSVRPSFSRLEELGSMESRRRSSAYMVEKDLPPTPTMSREMGCEAAAGISRTYEAPISAVPVRPDLRASPLKVDSPQSRKQGPHQQPTLALAKASLGLGLTNIVATSSPSPSPDISTVAFISESPVDFHPRIRRAKSSQKLRGAFSSDNPASPIPSPLDTTSRTRGISMGASIPQSNKGKAREPSDTPTPTLSRRTSFWSRRKKELTPPAVLDPHERTTRPSLPIIPVSPLIVELGTPLQYRDDTHRAPALSRCFSDRHSTHSPTPIWPASPEMPQTMPSSRRSPRSPSGRPATADSSSRSSPHATTFRPTTADSTSRPTRYFSASDRPRVSPVKTSTTPPIESASSAHLRPRSQTNPPLLHRLSVNLFSSSSSSTPKTSGVFGTGMFSSPPTSANNSPRPSTSKKPAEVPKPQMQDESPDAYVDRLLSIVSKAEIAGVLASSGDPFYTSALRSYINRFDFKDDPLDVALRKLLMEVGLPRETQQIDRVVEAFAGQYLHCNPNLFISDDHPYILAFSLIMLHTDAFNKSNRRKMTKPDYVKNTRLPGVPPEVLDCFFDNIVFAPFIFIEDPLDVNGQRSLIPAAISAQSMSRSSTQTNGSSATLLGKGSKIDPYFLITHDLLDPLRVPVQEFVPLCSPYSYTGTGPLWDEEELHRAFAQATAIEISAVDSQRGTPPLFSVGGAMPSPITVANALPEFYPATGEILTLKITKIGLLSRKDDTLEGGRRATNRKWKIWSVILTGSQLLFFRDPVWATTLLAKPGSLEEQVVFPQTSLFKPDELLSVKDAVAVFDKSYTKYLNTLRFVSSDGRQFLLRTSNETDLNAWISRINYASAFKSAGVHMRALGMSGKDVELTGVAAATSHLHDMQYQARSTNKTHSWGGEAALDLMDMLSGNNSPLKKRIPTSRKVTMVSGRNDMDLDGPTAPELEGAYQFKVTFDQVKAELAAGNWSSDESLDTCDVPLSRSVEPVSPGVVQNPDPPLPSRSHIIQSKVSELESKITAAQSLLAADLRFVRNVATLTPFQKATRDRLQVTVQTISGRIAKMRIELAKLGCHRNILSSDLVAEQRDLHAAKDLAFRAAAQTLQSRRITHVPQMTLSFHDEPTTSPVPSDTASLGPESSIAESFHSALDFGPDWSSLDTTTPTNLFLDTSNVFDSSSLSTPVTPGGTYRSSGSFPFPDTESTSTNGINRHSAIPSEASTNISHARFYTATDATEEAEECEDWNKTRAAKRVSLIRVPSDIRPSSRFAKQTRQANIEEDP